MYIIIFLWNEKNSKKHYNKITIKIYINAKNKLHVIHKQSINC